jgi:hypothetical protein
MSTFVGQLLVISGQMRKSLENRLKRLFSLSVKPYDGLSSEGLSLFSAR